MVAGTILSRKANSWEWKAKADESNIFSVKSLRDLVDNNLDIHNHMVDFLWVNWVPIKVNCFVWRLLCNKIPVACNL